MEPLLEVADQRGLGSGDQSGESRKWTAHPHASERESHKRNYSHRVGLMEDEV